ncbi:MAG: hypothetical protein SAK29_05700 [Scytonema sp. PMC 1069.18]|nr:hypothetical protein [Scytonema sp. PMC 1069.18]MEC4884700.1 hypothetical protein [Scytonema sp. PMC 1070.18]
MKKLPLDLKQLLNAKLKLRTQKIEDMSQKLIFVNKLKGLCKELYSIFLQGNHEDCTYWDSQWCFSVIKYYRQQNLTHILLRGLLYYKDGEKASINWEQGAENRLNDCPLYPIYYLWMRMFVKKGNDFQFFADLVEDKMSKQ